MGHSNRIARGRILGSSGSDELLYSLFGSRSSGSPRIAVHS